MDIYHSLFQDCGDAIVIADQQAQIIFANGAARSLFHDDLSTLTDPTTASCLLFEVNQANHVVSSPLSLLPEVLTVGNFRDREWVLRSPNTDTEVWLSVTGCVIKMPEQERGILLIIHDISKYKQERLDSLQSSYRDKLTGLVNRTVFMDRIEHALVRARQQEHALVAILYLDIKRLKAVNDTFGYAVGDELIVAVAHRLTHCLRPTDTLSRLGGDEFTLLVEDITSFSEVEAIVETVYEALHNPFRIQEQDIPVDISLGISLGRSTNQSAETLLRQADTAMNRAKKAFGEKYCVFKDSMETDSHHSLLLEMALKKAIENQELFLEFQPIFLVRNQRIIGMESLVRWQHPEQGILMPSNFISLAEKTGLIIPIGWWVLEASCRQLKIWQETILASQSLFVSVNMSSQQFSQKDVPGRIRQILDAVGLAPECLRIEITEGVLIDNSTSIIEILDDIRAMGIKLSIDDFGTGYSSLSYLHKFPFDTLKIDRSFLENADSDFEKLEILQAMVRLAWNLGLEVVAEGIETPRHLAQIKSLRCESGQGFLFSKPLNIQAMEVLLRSS